MALTEKLTAIADAIRAKTGNSGSLTLDQMPGEIAGIQAGGGADLSYDSGTRGAFIQRVAIGANSVTNTELAYTYFSEVCSGTSLLAAILVGECTANNQLVSYVMIETAGQLCVRYRNNVMNSAKWNMASYDTKLVEGTEYVVLSATNEPV